MAGVVVRVRSFEPHADDQHDERDGDSSTRPNAGPGLLLQGTDDYNHLTHRGEPPQLQVAAPRCFNGVMPTAGAPPPRQRPTIRQIADLASVSIATVSRVMNGHADVSRETREAVQRVAREHGYDLGRASMSARFVTGLIGVTMPFTAPAYFGAILSGATEALAERDMRIVLCPTRYDHDRERSLLERLSHGATDGALLVQPEESADELATLSEHGYRFVVVDPLEWPGDGVPVVSAAHGSAAMQATHHLVSLGHRRIGAITGPLGWMATVGRLRGYHAGLAGAGVLPDPRLEIVADFQVAGGRTAAERLLGLAQPPTAILAFNDDMAIGALQAAAGAGLDVPRDLSVVGIDDVPEAVLVTPALTTVRQPLAEMGRMAVSLLLRLLEHQQYEPLHVELATSLVVRASTAPPAH